MTPEFEAFVRSIPRSVFEPSGQPASASEFDRRFEVPLYVFPHSYRAFMTILGPGWWPNESGIVISPAGGVRVRRPFLGGGGFRGAGRER